VCGLWRYGPYLRVTQIDINTLFGDSVREEANISGKMADDKKGDPTDPKNQVISSSPLADQLPKEISKMLEGGAKA
jgi:hypothetical protein